MAGIGEPIASNNDDEQYILFIPQFHGFTHQQGGCELVKALLHVDDSTVKALLSDIHEVCQADTLQTESKILSSTFQEVPISCSNCSRMGAI